MSTDFETYLLSKGVSQIHVDTLQARGIDNKKILMFATIEDFCSTLQLPMFSAVCLFHMIREPFEVPTTVQQVLSSAQVADRHLIFFRRLEIKSVNELKGVTAKHLRGMACPVFPAHLLEKKLQDYFNKKRKQSDSPITSPKRQRSFSEDEGYGTEVQESDSDEEELPRELKSPNKPKQQKKLRACFTPQEDAAILEGVKIFGDKHWTPILNHFDILKNTGRLPTSLANRYKNYLKESEEESEEESEDDSEDESEDEFEEFCECNRLNLGEISRTTFQMLYKKFKLKRRRYRKDKYTFQYIENGEKKTIQRGLNYVLKVLIDINTKMTVNRKISP